MNGCPTLEETFIIIADFIIFSWAPGEELSFWSVVTPEHNNWSVVSDTPFKNFEWNAQ
jgi:hypothetical protein